MKKTKKVDYKIARLHVKGLSTMDKQTRKLLTDWLKSVIKKVNEPLRYADNCYFTLFPIKKPKKLSKI